MLISLTSWSCGKIYPKSFQWTHLDHLGEYTYPYVRIWKLSFYLNPLPLWMSDEKNSLSVRHV